MITIGLIDNYAIIRLGLAFILNENFKEMELLEASTASDFSKLYAKKKLDVLILGNNSSNSKECFEEVISLRIEFPQVPILVYDENIKQNMTVQYFELGISGYISKENITGEIVKGIYAVKNKGQFICPSLLDRLLRIEAKRDVDPKKSKMLTVRETQVAQYLSQGMRTSWIANTLGRKPSTISTIKNTIFRKMNVENIIQLRSLFSVRDTKQSVN
jgi:DNA-binding NarL/FixJ family response regulator